MPRPAGINKDNFFDHTTGSGNQPTAPAPSTSSPPSQDNTAGRNVPIQQPLPSGVYGWWNHSRDKLQLRRTVSGVLTSDPDEQHFEAWVAAGEVATRIASYVNSQRATWAEKHGAFVDGGIQKWLDSVTCTVHDDSAQKLFDYLKEEVTNVGRRDRPIHSDDTLLERLQDDHYHTAAAVHGTLISFGKLLKELEWKGDTVSRSFPDADRCRKILDTMRPSISGFRQDMDSAAERIYGSARD